MRISNNYFTDNFLSQVSNLKQQQNMLQTQASTGLKVTLPEDNPAVMTQVLDLQTASSQNSQYQNNITQLQNAATTSYTAMDNLKTISSRADQIATLASSGTTSATNMASYATEVGQLIQEAVQAGNTQDVNGNYIFAGTASGAPPFTPATDASGNVTAVTYNGNTGVAQSEIAPNVTVTAQTPGANTTGSGPSGLFTDSRAGADFFNHLISLQKNLQAGNSSAISSTDAPALQKDESNIINHVSANSLLQSRLTTATSTASAQSTNLTTQISGATNADLATTLTQLQQTQTAYQAALTSGNLIMNLSLLNYLH
jgi:flagellar hook-associated protein 3 FlgL